ncbi:malate dehydrogenase (quinone) [Staphylococcus lutrae]|uniref:Probable malate:quinone oxidoreductase n=1 Tax=Staphylococcus lutrae TaxID=155085 RepID=A0AAC9RRR4_9STAP|nr:malate dehydrogenase (quinone) [Staphylococcus lutrae]ARJ50516.1 malate dehydrogenase (quinone) [Staphylococcus lutrae]PNZ37418.1 malate dehydrogenase (quinone) [Staphylococcus lutrae]
MKNIHNKTDVVLIGGGIMSATLGTLLKALEPEWDINVFERLDQCAQESSNAWNNAGTGHSALCELNYTSEKTDGTIDITKAIKINEQFQVSKQFWSYLVKSGQLDDPESFIRTVPHMSFVTGDKNVNFLKARVNALRENVLFQGMDMTDEYDTLKEWIPLMMEGRNPNGEAIAATRDESGTDVNFGRLTQKLLNQLEAKGGALYYEHEVQDLTQHRDGTWTVKIKDLKEERVFTVVSKFVFIGAGGASLPLLQKTGLPESKHIGGFPVSGLFLTCKNPEVVARHHAKVYGKAEVGAPPMSVPHLDTRYIDGERALLFGPYAGFSPKFLKTGSYLDLIKSVKPNNVTTMLAAGAKELGLTKYLIQQLLLSNEQRMNALRTFIPTAKNEDWQVIVAGQRVQVIKDTAEKGKGTLQFGTEVITSADGTLAALLGASPGASTAVDVMLDVLQRAFPQSFKEWETSIKAMIPSFGLRLTDEVELFKKLNHDISKHLKLDESGTLLS